MNYSKEQRIKAVEIASKYEHAHESLSEVREYLDAPTLTLKTLKRWLDAQDQSTLNDQQRMFVICYLQCWNATKAAKLAGYSESTAYQIGHALLKNVEIQNEIQAFLNNAAMDSKEVLMRLSAHGQADVTEFLGLTEEQLKEHPKSWLLKKVKFTERSLKGSVLEKRYEFEVHDPQSALVHIGRHHQLFTDKSEVDITSGGKPITFRVVYDDEDKSDHTD